MARDTLTEMQRAFAFAYVGPAKGNGTAAARIAGATGSDESVAVTASKWLKMAKVSDLIRELTADSEDASLADSVETRRFLTGVMRGTECRVPIITMAGPVFEADGETIKTKPADPKDRVKAATELARMSGWYAPDKAEVTHGGQIVRILMPSNGRGPAPELE
jgi:phage terminase small subunit